jgi:deazaflavin-dependent oxidoreductase (nitroreductase family)
MTIGNRRTTDYSNEQFLYLTTTGRKTGLPREIEIWFVERDGCLYVLAEHGHRAQWVQNILANSSATIRLSGKRWKAKGRVLDSGSDVESFTEVRALARDKYGWGDGLPVEFRLQEELQD